VIGDGTAWARDEAANDTIEWVISVIDDHIPSLTDENDLEIDERRFNSDVDRFGQPRYENADLARRTCKCGVVVDGFYEYVDHLKEILK
jgi:hypothetical protein